MGKKNLKFEKIDIPEKGTLLEKFTKYLESHKKKSDVIKFLSVINAKYIGMRNQFSEKDKEEIIEFAAYFETYFYDLMYEDMMENWGQDPYILRLAEQMVLEGHLAERKEVIKNASEAVKKEAKTLADTLFNIREYRCFTTSYFSPEEGAVSGQMELPKTIYKEELNDAKEELYYVCIQVVENRGSIVTRLVKKDHAEVFGIRVLPFGVWSPISKEEMQTASLTTPNGIELEPEEGVVYTEIQRERF